MDTLEKIRHLAEKICKDHGIDLFDVEMHGSGRRTVLRVYIDCETGITVEDCAVVSRELSTTLDVVDPIPGMYHLEVSSPGLDRPIRHTEDARKVVGKLIKVKTRKEIGGRRHFKGRLVSVKGEVWILFVEDAEVVIDARLVEKANLIYEF